MRITTAYNDTDNDGMDLVKALVEVSRSAVEGVDKAAAIYACTPTLLTMKAIRVMMP